MLKFYVKFFLYRKLCQVSKRKMALYSQINQKCNFISRKTLHIGEKIEMLENSYVTIKVFAANRNFYQKSKYDHKSMMAYSRVAGYCGSPTFSGLRMGSTSGVGPRKLCQYSYKQVFSVYIMVFKHLQVGDSN